MIYFTGSIYDSQSTEMVQNICDTLGITKYKISTYTDNIMLNRGLILQEISVLKPEAVICLGSNALKNFVEVHDDRINAVRQLREVWNGIPLYCTYNPNYLAKQGQTNKGNLYLAWQNDIKQAYNETSNNYQEEQIPVKLFTLDNYLDFIKEVSKLKPPLSLDYEASSLSSLQQDFYLAGIGIGNSNQACYLSICDYADPDIRLNQEQRNKLSGLMKWLNKPTTLAFNLNYEYLATLSQFGVRLDQLVDCMQTAKALDIRGGLKEQSQLQLGIRGWTKDIDQWLENLEIVLGLFKPTNTVNGLRDKKQYNILVEKSCKEALDSIKAKDLKSTPRVIQAIDYIIEKSTEIYGSEDKSYELLGSWIKYKHSKNDWEIRYTDLPKELNNLYCGLDTVYCCRLQDKYEKEIKERNLEHAAEVYNRQMQFACELEVTGFRWDDDKAEELKIQYTEKAVEALRNFLLTGRAKSVLEINSVQEIEILSATNLDQLKKFFNPDSTAPKNTEILSQILSSDKIKMAMMFQYINTEYLQINSKIERECPTLVKLMLNFNRDISNYPNIVIQAVTQAHHNGSLTLEEQAILGKFAGYKLPNAASETIEAVASACKKYLGVDVDKEETWTDDYKAVYYYKTFKKISKAISSFIDGANARKLVQIVEKEKANGYYKRVCGYRRLDSQDLDIEYVTNIISRYNYEEIINAGAMDKQS